MLAIDGRKRQTFDVDLGRALARVKGRGALAGLRGSAPYRSPQGAEPPAQAKRRKGRSINFGLTPEINANSPVDCFAVGDGRRSLTLPSVGGLPMGAQSASMTAQTISYNHTLIYKQTSKSNISTTKKVRQNT